MVSSFWPETFGNYRIKKEYQCFRPRLWFTGFPLIEISQRLGQTSQVYGIDPWEEALDRIRLKLRVYNIKNVELINGYAENMPFDNNYFDLIVSNNGINNVRDITKTMKECHRVCKPDAQMVFTLNTQETMMEFYSVFQEVLEEEGLKEEVKKMKAHIYLKRKPVEEIKTLTEEAGFTVNNIINDSFKLNFIDGTTMLNHNLIKYWFLESWKNILNQKDLVCVFDKVESRLNEQSQANGRLTLTVPFVTFNCRKH